MIESRVGWLPPVFSQEAGKAVGARLRELRVAAKLSQVDVAVLLESHRPVISRLERGVHMPKIDTIILFAEVCDGDAYDVALVLDRVIAEYQVKAPEIPKVIAPRGHRTICSRPGARRR